MAADLNCDVTRQAATTENEVTINYDNFSEMFFESLKTNLNSCETYDLISNETFSVNSNIAHLIIHVNISSLQSYFQNLTQFLKCMKTPPSIILLSETRTNVEPHTNIDIPGYTFFHFPSSTIVGGVGAYFSNLISFTEIKCLKLKTKGCEDLWFEVQFPGRTDRYTIAVIYRHPENNVNIFLDALDDKLQILNNNRRKVILMGDLIIDLNSDSSRRADYVNLIESNTFSSLITQPTRVTADSQTIIDHILTNDNKSVITPSVFLHKLADHYAICCSITNPNFKNTNNIRNTYACRNYRSVDGSKFRTDLESSLLPLINDITNSSVTSSSLDFYFNSLITTISEVIEKHAPLHTASRKQKRIQSKPWLTKGLLKPLSKINNYYINTFFSVTMNSANYITKNTPTK